SYNHAFPVLIPTQRRLASSPIKCFIRSHSNARMIAVVVGELYQWQDVVPTSSVI
ncbi:hypothetical protein A2U01_0079870, partial [Trifolium medium]|nr:hypothetical protein [Trifolium medium]